MSLPVAERWFRTAPLGAGVTLLSEPYANPYLWSNIWHVRGRDRDLLVDTGNGIGRLRPFIEELSVDRAAIVVVTHSHFDHMGGLHEFEERWCHREDAADVETVEDPLKLLGRDLSDGFREDMSYYGYEPPERLLDALPFGDFDVERFATQPATVTRRLDDGDAIDLGDRAFEVLHVPGHTTGSIALWDEVNGVLFTGDALYADDPLSAVDRDAFSSSLERLRELAFEVVHGGHNRSFGADEARSLIDGFLAG